VFWFVLTHLVAFLVDLFLGARQRDREKDLQILVLRQQVRLLQRQRPRPPRLTRSEKLTLAVLAAALARLTIGPRHQLDQYLLLFKPDTILKWLLGVKTSSGTVTTELRSPPAAAPYVRPWSCPRSAMIAPGVANCGGERC